MNTKIAIAAVLLALCVSPVAVRAQEAKHPIVDRLTDLGPNGKRQAGYMFKEITSFFMRVDEVMTSDDTSKTRMENAYQRATQRSIDNWNERAEKLVAAYVSWAKSRGQTTKKLPADWNAYMNRIQVFLADMADGRGYNAAVWKRELNTANKRFAKFAKRAPAVRKTYLADVKEADEELSAAEETLDQEVATLDDLKRHRRHLGQVRNMIKNLSRHLVDQQKRGREIMSDKTLKAETFQKGLDAINEWKAAVEGEADLPTTCKQVPGFWAQYGKEALDKYRKSYGEVEKLLGDFIAGDIFDDSDYFSGVDYDDMLSEVDSIRERVNARIDKILGR